MRPYTQRSTPRLSYRLLLAPLGLAALAVPRLAEAATVWAGPRVTHGNTDQPDQMTANVAITRGATQGIYNSVQEGGFTHFLSPKDTEWADGTTANYATLTVGVNAVVHLTTDDIYIDIKFLTWSADGSYAYERSRPAAANAPPTVSITNPIEGASGQDVAVRAASPCMGSDRMLMASCTRWRPTPRRRTGTLNAPRELARRPPCPVSGWLRRG